MFEIDPDKPNLPAIARILKWLGILCLVGSGAGMILSFSGYAWVNPNYAIAGAVAVFLIAVVMVGQATTLELLAVVSARVKSRFAIDHATMPAAAPAQAAERKPAPITATKERVITIPEEVARQQGVTRRRTE